MHKLLAAMLEERSASIEDALTQLEQSEHAQTGLHNLQAHLLNLLELIERNAGVTAAADDLLSTATAFVGEIIRHEPACSERRSGASKTGFRPRV